MWCVCVCVCADGDGGLSLFALPFLQISFEVLFPFFAFLRFLSDSVYILLHHHHLLLLPSLHLCYPLDFVLLLLLLLPPPPPPPALPLVPVLPLSLLLLLLALVVEVFAQEERAARPLASSRHLQIQLCLWKASDFSEERRLTHSHEIRALKFNGALLT